MSGRISLLTTKSFLSGYLNSTGIIRMGFFVQPYQDNWTEHINQY